MGGLLLGDQLLGAVRSDSDHPAPGIGGPQGPIRFGQDAFGALKVVTNVLQRGRIDAKIQNWIRSHRHDSNTFRKLSETAKVLRFGQSSIIDSFPGRWNT